MTKFDLLNDTASAVAQALPTRSGVSAERRLTPAAPPSSPVQGRWPSPPWWGPRRPISQSTWTRQPSAAPSSWTLSSSPSTTSCVRHSKQPPPCWAPESSQPLTLRCTHSAGGRVR
ncbi:hypothetical protein [Nesterenkonia pannonica]|uniref:hypothetical protein n=1 Tax=Nesterenkonia pannonica TaxID=1548602 RepID=UPI0021648A02|nr:hypothetical protein [Nesterenkonia pannonica]